MTTAAPEASVEVASLAVLTVYLRRDLAEAARVLHVLDRRAFGLEQVQLDLGPLDTSQVRGLEAVKTQVMKLVLTVREQDVRGIDRMTRLLDRLVEVYQVVPTAGPPG